MNEGSRHSICRDSSATRRDSSSLTCLLGSMDSVAIGVPLTMNEYSFITMVAALCPSRATCAAMASGRRLRVHWPPQGGAMKRMLLFWTASVVGVSLVACGDKGDDSAGGTHPALDLEG